MINKLTMIGLGVSGMYVASRSGALDADPTFEQPAGTAIARLSAKSRVVEGTGMGRLTVAGRGARGTAVAIAVTQAGNPRALTCNVTVTAVTAQRSRAETDCTQRGPGDAATRELGRKALNIIVREHVAATVEQRRYDIDKVGDRMLAFAAFNGPALMAAK